MYDAMGDSTSHAKSMREPWARERGYDSDACTATISSVAHMLMRLCEKLHTVMSVVSVHGRRDALGSVGIA